MVGRWFWDDEEFTEPARNLLDDFREARVDLIASSHLNYEVLSLLTRALRRHRLHQHQVRTAITEFFVLDIRTVQSRDLLLAGHA